MSQHDAQIFKRIAELETGLEIDRNDLDNCLQQQPDCFYRVSKLLTQLISERDAAKTDLAKIDAEVDAKIRKQQQFRDHRATEKEIEALKRVNEDIDEATQKLHQLNHFVGLLSGLKESFQQRSFALRELTALYIANYYGDGSQDSSKNLHEHRANVNRERMSEMRKSRT